MALPNFDPPEGIYRRCATLFDYWLVSDHTIAGQRFVIEQHGKRRGWADPICYGTEYYVDGVCVHSTVFDRALKLATLKNSEEGGRWAPK